MKLDIIADGTKLKTYDGGKTYDILEQTMTAEICGIGDLLSRVTIEADPTMAIITIEELDPYLELKAQPKWSSSRQQLNLRLLSLEELIDRLSLAKDWMILKSLDRVLPKGDWHEHNV